MSNAEVNERQFELEKKQAFKLGSVTALEWAAEWCEQQIGEFAQFFTPEAAAHVFRARADKEKGGEMSERTIESYQTSHDLRERVKELESPTHFEMKIDLSRIVLKVCIPGEPQAWERCTYGKYHGKPIDTKDNKAAKLTIRQYIMLANPRLKPDPNSRFGKIYMFATHLWTTDEDNYTKLVNDAVKGMIWKDDRQADESYVRVARGPQVDPQTQLIFYTLMEPWKGRL